MCQPANNLAFKADLKKRFYYKGIEKNSPKSKLSDSQACEAKLLTKEEDSEAMESSLKTVSGLSSRKSRQSFKGELKKCLNKKDRESLPIEISESSIAAAREDTVPQISKEEACESKGTVLYDQETNYSWVKDKSKFLEDNVTLFPQVESPYEDVVDSSEIDINELLREETSKLSEVQLCLVRASKSLVEETKMSTATKVSTEDATEEKAYENSYKVVKEFLQVEISESSQEYDSNFSDGKTVKSSEREASESSMDEATASLEKKDSETSQGEISEFSKREILEPSQEDASNFSDGEVRKLLEGKANELFTKKTTESPKDKDRKSSQGEISESSKEKVQEQKATKEEVWESKCNEENNYFWQRKKCQFLEDVSTQSMNREATDPPEDEYQVTSQEENSDSSMRAAKEEQATMFCIKGVWESKEKVFYDDGITYSWQKKILQFFEGVSTQSMSGEATNSPEEEYQGSSKGEITDLKVGATQEEKVTKFTKGEVCESTETVFSNEEANYSWQGKLNQFLEGVSTQSMSGEASDSPEEEDLESSQEEFSDLSKGKESNSSLFSSENSDVDTAVGNATLSSVGETLSSSESFDGIFTEKDSHSFEGLSSSFSSDASTSEIRRKSPSQKNGFFNCRICELFDKVSRGMKGAFCLQPNEED